MLHYIDTYCTSVRLDGEIYTAILKPEYAVEGERVIKADAKSAYAGKWVTINGARVLIGKNGVVLGGAGGKFNGMNLSDGVRKLHRNRDTVVKAKEYERLKKVADSDWKLNQLDGQIKETITSIAKRTKIFGAKHFKVTTVKNQLKNLKAERKAVLKTKEQAQAKMERIKAKYPDVEKTIENLGNTQKRREANKLRAWAKENGYNPNASTAVLANLKDRSANKPYKGGVWTGDEFREDATQKWVTINGAKVLIKNGKFTSGPLAGKFYGENKYFSGNAKMSGKHKVAIIEACDMASKDGKANVYMDNYKIELKLKNNFPQVGKDEMIVTAHNVVQHTGAGMNRKMTITKHPVNKVGDRLAELRELIKPKDIQVTQ